MGRFSVFVRLKLIKVNICTRIKFVTLANFLRILGVITFVKVIADIFEFYFRFRF